MKPRIAFCFSGQARTFDITYPYFKKNLFDAATEQGFEYDIFCAVEDDQDAQKIFIMNPQSYILIKSEEVERIISESHGSFINNQLKKYCFYIGN
jgi:hypothetical protein